ncbi:MAG: hypothetical protein ACREIC_14410 [Limisphaerales bacterium]
MKLTKLTTFLCVLLGITGCTVYMQPSPEAVAPPPPDPAPVVVEEGVYPGFVVAPVNVEYVFVGGRYCYWHPEYHRWFYRPYAWHPAYGARVLRAENIRALNAYHRPEVRPNPYPHREPARPEPVHTQQNNHPTQTARPQQQRSKRSQPAEEKKKKEEH